MTRQPDDDWGPARDAITTDPAPSGQRGSGGLGLAAGRIWGVACLAAAFLVAGGSGASATPLSRETCQSLEREHATLEAAGMPEILKKGPEWGKSNLVPARLKEVERFIVLEEQLLFRCGLAKVRAKPSADSVDGDQAAAAEGQQAPPLPRRKPGGLARSAAVGAAAPPKAKPKAQGKASASGKPRIDDAYRPPAPPSPTATETKTNP